MQQQTCNNAFEEELLVLASIYGDDSMTRVKDDKVIFSFSEHLCTIVYTVDLVSYPTTSSPSIDLRCSCKESFKRQLESEVREITSRGNDVMLYAVIDHIKQRMEISEIVRDGSISETSESFDEIFEQQPSTIQKEVPQAIEIYHGGIVLYKKSSFQSHFAFIKSLDDINSFRFTITSDKKYSSATHNIFCYRFHCSITGLLYHDYDDDGETAAGGRLAEMLRLMTKGDLGNNRGIALIVSRWFGGILLGPERFKFINNSARLLLEKHNIGLKK